MEFELREPAYPFVSVSDAMDCRVDLAKLLPRSDDKYTEYFSITGANPDRIMALAEAHDVVDPALVVQGEDGGLFEFVVDEQCPAGHLAERGAIPRDVVGEDGEGRIVVEVPPPTDPPEVVAAFLSDHESAELVAKRETDRCTPLFTERELQAAVETRLTERQREVLHTAYERGYYDHPRGLTGEEIAAELDISSATFAEHIREAERQVMRILFEDELV